MGNKQNYLDRAERRKHVEDYYSDNGCQLGGRRGEMTASLTANPKVAGSSPGTSTLEKLSFLEEKNTSKKLIPYFRSNTR